VCVCVCVCVCVVHWSGVNRYILNTFDVQVTVHRDKFL